MSIDEQVSDRMRVKSRRSNFFDKKTLFRIVNVYLAHNSHCISDREYMQSMEYIRHKFGWSNLLTDYLSQENFKN